MDFILFILFGLPILGVIAGTILGVITLVVGLIGYTIGEVTNDD